MKKNSEIGIIACAGLCLLSLVLSSPSTRLLVTSAPTENQPRPSSLITNALAIANASWLYPGSAQFYARSVAVDASGAIYITGKLMYTDATVHGVVAKFAPGSTQPAWNRTFGTPVGGSDIGGHGIVLDKDGNILVTGNSNNTDSTAMDVCVMKYSPNGDLLWNKSWGILGVVDKALGIATDASGNCYIVGTTSFVDANGDALLIKFAPDGTLLWNITWGSGTTAEKAFGVVIDGNGNIIITGDQFDGVSHVMVVKFAPNKTQLWNWNWSYSTEDAMGRGIAVDTSGNIYVSGMNSSGSSYIILIAFDSIGNSLWNSTFATANCAGYGVVLDGYGNCYVAASGPLMGGTIDAFILQFTTGGKYLTVGPWLVPGYGGPPGSDIFYGVALAPNGHIIACGSTDSWSSVQNLLWVEIAPLGISHPVDITYVVGTTGHLITWNITNPYNGTRPTYSVSNGSTMVATGIWATSVPFSVNVDGLAIGATTYTIVANNNQSAPWNYTFTDIVVVNVTAASAPVLPDLSGVTTVFLIVEYAGFSVLTVAFVYVEVIKPRMKGKRRN